MTEQSDGFDQQRSARRRLIKGSFAAPAALTLTSGSAFARTSSLCVANDANAKVAPAYDDPAAASYQRLQAYSYVPNGQSKITSYWIKGSDILALASAGGVGLSPAAWITTAQNLCVEGGSQPTGNSLYVAGTIYNGAPPSLTPSARYYAVLFDVSGNVTGIAKVYGSGGAVHHTCWSSFITGI